MAASPVSQTRSFNLAIPCDRALPLFTAEGEKKWAPGWEPEQLSGDERCGSVFRTRQHDGRLTTWIVTDYDPAAGRASYARLAEGSNMGLVDVRCSRNGTGSTVRVTYTLTGLSAEGHAFVGRFLSDPHYDAMMVEWEQALSALFAGQR